MSDKSGGSMMWLFMALLIGCVAYLTYGTVTAVAAYILVNIAMSICAILSIIPFVGVFLTAGAAIFAGNAILSAAGLATGTSLFYAIFIYNMIIAIVVCGITSIGLLKLAFD